MLTAVFRALVFACFACLAHPALPAPAAAAAPAAPAALRIAMDGNYPPFSYRTQDGKLEGYTVDLWRLWSQETGVPVELVAGNWAQVLPMLERGEADVIDPIFRTTARGGRFDFSEPYGSAVTSVYADASVTGIHDVASLKGFEVAVQEGDACAEHLRRAGIENVRVFPSYEALAAAAAERSVKLFCLDQYSADHHLYRLGLQRRYVKAFEVTHDQLRRAVRKGDAATLALVQDGMARIPRAQIDALHDKWIGRPLVFTRYARGMALALAGLAGVLLLLLAWLATVRRAVRLRTAQLEHERAQLRALVESSPDLIWLKDAAGVYRDCNAGAALLLGRPRAAVIGCTDDDLFGPTLGARHREADAAALRAGRPLTHEEPVALPGPYLGRVYETVKSPVVKPDGTVLGVLGVARDITERRRLEQSMRMADLIYRTSLEAIVVSDEANRIVDANPAFTAQTGYELADVLGQRPPLFGAGTQDGFNDCMRRALAAHDHWQGEVLDRNKDGSFTAKFVNIRVIRDPGGGVYRHVIQFHDISEQKKKDELIWRQTNFDTLTGLPNRRLFLDRLDQDIKKAQSAGAGLGVLLLDLDRFKDVNDSFGHAMGDHALIELTRRMAGCLPGDATMARLGGNVFALVAGEFEQRPHLETTAGLIIGAVAAPMPLGPGAVAHLSASVGISVYPDDGAGAADLVRNAEQALHQAKQAGRGRFQYFTPALQQQARAKLMLTNDLRQAVARGQLQLYYQPIVEVATGRIHKAETLLRWFHPEHGMVSPATFIPLAEEAGLIHDIGDWVMREAIARAAAWRHAYGRMIELGVNISPLQFAQPGPLSWLELLAEAGLAPHSITVEITEGVLVDDPERVRGCLAALHAAGGRVAIDDFGTGFSSLAYLKHFDVDYLKIDKVFIDDLAGGGREQALVEAMVDLAHRLGIEAIAEGVETRAQRDILAGFGCDWIQGYHYAPPLARADFERLLETEQIIIP